MKMRAVHSPEVRTPKAKTWTNCKVCGEHVFISGMTAHDLEGNVVGDGSMYDQSKQAFRKIRHLMEAAGGKMNDIIKVTIFVTDIKQREEVWRAREEFFSGDFPCSTLVEVRALATPQLLVEIEAVGFLGAGAD
jgi:2-iminobutanoate/2-iminopropanoate deaminase